MALQKSRNDLKSRAYKGLVIKGEDHTYTITKPVNKGGCGEVWECIDELNTKYIVKAQLISTDKTGDHIKKEYELYKSLHNYYNVLVEHEYFLGFHLPKVYHYDNKLKLMVMQKLGPSLAERKPAKCEIPALAICMIDALIFLHMIGYVHSDIKPENILIGPGIHGGIGYYLIDFGVTTAFLDDCGRRLPDLWNKSREGTSIYASIDQHMSRSAAVRDDLESLAYTLAYLWNGYLPWTKYDKYITCDRTKRYIYLKSKRDVETIYKCVPYSIAQFIDYISHLGRYEKPEYNLFKQIFVRHAFGMLPKTPYWSMTDEEVEQTKEEYQYRHIIVYPTSKRVYPPGAEISYKGPLQRFIAISHTDIITDIF